MNHLELARFVHQRNPDFSVGDNIYFESMTAVKTPDPIVFIEREKTTWKVWVIRPGELVIQPPGMDHHYAKIRGKRITMPNCHGRVADCYAAPILEKYNDYLFEKNFL